MAALVAAGCGQRAAPAYQGYIEGEYLYLAAPQPGYLQSLDAVRGSRITAGQLVFTIAADPDLQALAQADAQAQSARQRVDNLKEPRRAPEIAALEANLRSAESSLALAGTRLRQQQALAQRNFVSKAALDQARAEYQQAQAQLDAVREQLATYRSSLGRQAEVRGAEADLRAADALVAQKRWAVERKNVAAPAAGEITETYYRPGEWVPAGTPVAALLPDTRRRLRFFVPETELARLAPGKLVEASCDGCAAPIRATIDFVAAQAEYTPPVIYSRGNREKLVFRVEAAPALEQAAGLRPGLPIDVRLVEAR
ncbi:MAG: HlyD family efflux transporter periplasmic adaptor subunit [Burkholderiales bacterium]|nr:HlyD family efflux transporter periplasmic adaptor subunit [Burkholderiales bacterium]